jgi:hypothetical protein
MVKMGPTGDFPDGKLGPRDEGGLMIGIAHDSKKRQVVINFGGPVSWLAMPPEQAIGLAELLFEHALLLKHAKDLQKEKAS